MPVDHCVCRHVSFVRMKEYAEEHPGAGLPQLQQVFGCGQGCGLCIPYVRAMLRTGRTSFDPVGGLDEPVPR
ncbi:MAG: (2Fe-2S)-binding protein [Planctomycetota bacterium]|jgi:bacterioferritin-associated ferredoxin